MNLKMKIFQKRDIEEVQNDVNLWLRKQPGSIIIKRGETSTCLAATHNFPFVTITIWYEDKRAKGEA